ncbi:predicted protein [Naegleria gruberi]|uniref:Predicted protein n=1 Tax=Naegleria gruberi TaxID=5762 RepID=D2VFK0_NAEGR|nr:uncharacterized protein NAEGRDRAFT_67653 [Naegleria gruberi]EFC44483.1 predicted protein [Naegleria gruberi]|eukprot:XP_002677227.1 predicted protein [Naegleria gruberi strain NEG-M]
MSKHQHHNVQQMVGTSSPMLFHTSNLNESEMKQHGLHPSKLLATSSSSTSTFEEKRTLVMIHGWLQNAQVFERKTLEFRKYHFERGNLPIQNFVYPNAPFVADIPPNTKVASIVMGTSSEVNKKPKECFRSWGLGRDGGKVHHGWRQCMNYLIRFIGKRRREGHIIEGLLGFSQGGMITSILSTLISLEFYGLLNRDNLPPSLFEKSGEDPDETNFDDIIEGIRKVFFNLDENGNKKCNLKFIILIGAFRPSSIQVSELLNVLLMRGLKIAPCFVNIHLIGLQDDIVKPVDSQNFAEDCFCRETSLILTHNDKHILPCKDEDGLDTPQFHRFIRSAL